MHVFDDVITNHAMHALCTCTHHDVIVGIPLLAIWGGGGGGNLLSLNSAYFLIPVVMTGFHMTCLLLVNIGNFVSLWCVISSRKIAKY